MSVSPYYRAEDKKGAEPKEEIPCRYEYHHGSGKHVLVRADPDINRPIYSFHCFLCNCIDVLIFVGCIALLFFAIRYALYQLENSDGG